MRLVTWFRWAAVQVHVVVVVVVLHAVAAPGRVEMDFQVEKVIWVHITSAEAAAVLEVPGLMGHTRTEGGMVEMARAPASQALPHFMAAEVADLSGRMGPVFTLVLEAWVVGATGESTISQRMALLTRVVAGAGAITPMCTVRAGLASSSSATSNSLSA